MIAWFLIGNINFTPGAEIVIPNIASREECVRISGVLKSTYRLGEFRCLEYRIAK